MTYFKMLQQSLQKMRMLVIGVVVAISPFALWVCSRERALPGGAPRAHAEQTPPPVFAPVDYRLVHIASFPLPGTARQIAIQNSHAFVALIMGGLAVLDISDIERIKLLCHVSTGVYPLSLVARGNRLYVADRFYGLQVFDISDPAQPKRAASLQMPGIPTSLVMGGDLIYVSCGGEGIAIIKEVKHNRFQEIGRFSEVNYTKMAEISGRYAYLADSYDDAFKILDLTNPIHPTLVKSFYVGGFCDTVRISDPLAFVCNRRRGIIILDVSDPHHPEPVAKIINDSGYIKDAYVLKNLLLVARDEPGLDLYDIEVPSSPTLCASYDTSGSATGIAVKLPYILVADWDKGLVVLKLETVEAKK
jgi:hypothetical protein